MRKENITPPCNLHGFRRLSGTPEPENAFTSKNLPFYDLNGESKPVDLTDSLEVVKRYYDKFNCVLKFTISFAVSIQLY